MKKLVLILALLICHHTAQAAFTQNETVAITILAEARGEGKAGMYAVACVIQQRVIERKLSADQVCKQKWQFSCWNANDPQNKSLNELLKLPEAKYAMQLAQGLSTLDRGFVKYANHYHTTKVHPTWSKGKTPVITIGNHLFFKL